MQFSFAGYIRSKRPVLWLIFSICLLACRDNKDTGRLDEGRALPNKKKINRLPGDNQTISIDEAEKGKVLIAYSDCASCHAVHTKAKGPAFRDIARRYPANEGYIEMLARKIILGGSRAWGYPVMTPHAELSVENARLMVKYILSLEKGK